MKRSIISAAALFLFLAGIAFAKGPQGAGPVAATIHMSSGKQYEPKSVTVNVGETVEWVNDDRANLHNVTTDKDATDMPKAIAMPRGAKPFNSGLMPPGKSFRYTFTVPGTYRYVCVPHQPDMVGVIVVRPK
jgi:plastocyanin